jgi:hypothetical protein
VNSIYLSSTAGSRKESDFMPNLEKLAKHWYTEQRGHVVGNTVAWDDLPMDARLNILDCVGETFETMEEAWQWRTKDS